MSAQIISAPCSYCKGSGKAESLVEKTEFGGWVPNVTLGHELADAWIKDAGASAPIKWVSCDCPVCAGEGAYELEPFPCLVF